MGNTRELAANLYHQLWLEVEHLKADMAYEAATSFCDDCPRKNWDDYIPQSYYEMEFGVQIADHCCKEDDDYHEIEWLHIAACEKIMSELKPFAGNEELAAAQARVAQVQK